MIKKFVENINDSRIHLISNSKFVQDSIKEKLNKNSEIIYPPVNLDEFQPILKEKNIVTIGRYSEEKHHEFGISVMKDLDYNYDIIGNTKTKSNILYYEQLENLIKTKNYKNIHLLKNLERKNLVEKVNKSKVYFHGSKETFGISTVESIAAGCIPIVPDIGGHKETVPFDELRYEQNNIEDAYQKIINAINGNYDSLLPELQKHGQKYDVKKFKDHFISFLNNMN